MLLLNNMKKSSVGFSAEYLYKVSVQKITCLIKMGQKPHRNEFITVAASRKKQYNQRLRTMMRKRWELEVMCGAKIKITLIRGESSTPNIDPCGNPDEMHGAEWYEQTKPKNAFDYFKQKLAKQKTSVQLLTYSEETEAGSNEQRPLTPIPDVATWCSTPTAQNNMQQLTDDNFFSQLFPTNPIPSPIVPTSTKKVDDQFISEKYKDMFASHKGAPSMFAHASSGLFKPQSPARAHASLVTDDSVFNQPFATIPVQFPRATASPKKVHAQLLGEQYKDIFAPAFSGSFRPPSPRRAYASMFTTQPLQQSLLGYSPTQNSGSMRVPSPRPEYGNVPLLGYTADQVPAHSSISEYDNLRLPSLPFRTSSIDNSAKTPIPAPAYAGQAPPEFRSTTGSPRSSALLCRVSSRPEPPPQSLLGITSAQNYRPIHMNEDEGLLPPELFFGSQYVQDILPPKSPFATTSPLNFLPNDEELLPTNSPFATTSALNYFSLPTLSPTPDSGSEVSAHMFFGTHTYNTGGAPKTPT